MDNCTLFLWIILWWTKMKNIFKGSPHSGFFIGLGPILVSLCVHYFLLFFLCVPLHWWWWCCSFYIIAHVDGVDRNNVMMIWRVLNVLTKKCNYQSKEQCSRLKNSTTCFGLGSDEVVLPLDVEEIASLGLLTLPPTLTYKSVRKAFNPTRCGWWQGTQRRGCHTNPDSLCLSYLLG